MSGLVRLGQWKVRKQLLIAPTPHVDPHHPRPIAMRLHLNQKPWPLQSHQSTLICGMQGYQGKWIIYPWHSCMQHVTHDRPKSQGMEGWVEQQSGVSRHQIIDLSKPIVSKIRPHWSTFATCCNQVLPDIKSLISGTTCLQRVAKGHKVTLFFALRVNKSPGEACTICLYQNPLSAKLDQVDLLQHVGIRCFQTSNHWSLAPPACNVLQRVTKSPWLLHHIVHFESTSHRVRHASYAFIKTHCQQN